ncbi:hypothetical protein [Heyndrickxia sporothermodurans]|uniref:hypothetical protein n=1 Tax=Heyndrickxia sporothermodurans TaxID=46224 RepID=UPI0035DF3AFA
MRIAKENVISWKWIFALVPIILFSFSNRHSINYLEEKHKVTANIWDFILSTLNDPYLMVYYIFPLIVFISTVYINRTFDYTKLIRLGSYKNWIFTKIKQLFLMDLYFICLFFGSILLATINTPLSMEWSELAKINEQSNAVLYTLQFNFSNPFVAMVLQIALFLLTLITVQFVICILYAIYKKQLVLHLLNILLFVLGIFSFKIFPASIPPFLVIPNYLLLYHGVERFNSTIMPFVSMILILGITTLIANNIDKNRSIVRQFLTKNYSIIIYSLLCLLGIWFNVERYANGEFSIGDIFTGTFFGTTNEMFSLLSFAYYVVVFVGFVYFVQLLLQRYLSEMSFYTMIRYRSMNKWFLSWFPKILKSIIILLGSLFAITISIALFNGIPLTLSDNWFQMIYQFMVNGFLQLLFYVLLVIIVSLFTQDVFKSFIALLVLTIFMLPGFKLNNFIPVGLNSMGYLMENVSIYSISLTLVGYIVIEIIMLLILINKKDYTL